nr:ash family protein [Escherichia coli]
MLVSGTHIQWKLIDLQSDLFAVVLNSVVHGDNHNKNVMFAQCIDSAISGRYTVPAPYKAGAGIGTPELHTAINDAPASFLSSTLTHIRIMVGWAGEPKGSPVSVCAGSSNPAQFTTSEIGTSGGGSYPLHTEAVIMTTIPTQSHPFLKIETVNGKTVTLSLFEYLKLLRLAGVPGYISRVAVNPATGFDSLKHINAHNRARGFFVCNARSRLNYGGLGRGAERLAGFVGVRSVNPAQVTTSCLTAARGDSPKLTNGAVDMTTTTTHSFLKIEVVNGKTVTLSLFEYLKLLRLAGVPGYISRVAVNPATGIGVPEYTEEHNRAHAVFSCYAHCHAQIMVGRAGASKDAPGSSVTGYANPVRLTTSVIGVPCGELKKLTEGGVK